MTMHVGAIIVDVLEQAGKRHLDPEAYPALLFHLGGSHALDRYDGSMAYWRRVQALLDAFFSSAERAAIGTRLIAEPRLRGCPEFRHFLGQALAERQVQSLVEVAMLAQRGSLCQPEPSPR
jgi:hypothetical protein